MAPEVIELKGATTKSDIWSLGCTLIELITGKPPYSELLPMSAMFRIVEDDHPPLPQNISDEMHNFLLCCFRKNPEQRLSSTELQSHPWMLNSHQKRNEKSGNRPFKGSFEFRSLLFHAELKVYFCRLAKRTTQL